MGAVLRSASVAPNRDEGARNGVLQSMRGGLVQGRMRSSTPGTTSACLYRMDSDSRNFRVFLGRHLRPVRVHVATSNPVDGRCGTRDWVFETLDGVLIGTVQMATEVGLLHPSREELEQQLDPHEGLREQMQRIRIAVTLPAERLGCDPGDG